MNNNSPKIKKVNISLIFEYNIHWYIVYFLDFEPKKIKSIARGISYKTS